MAKGAPRRSRRVAWVFGLHEREYRADMGWSFRRSINFGPLRLNLGKRGIGTSVGAGPFRIGRSADGRTYRTFRIPGTGILYRDSSGSGGGRRAAGGGGQAGGCGCLGMMVIAVTLAALAALAAWVVLGR